MKQSSLFALASSALALVLVPGPAAAQKVTYDFSRTANFAHVRTFMLDKSQKSDNPLVDQRVDSAITQMLTARGLTRVNHDPDVVIVPSRTTEMRKEVTAYSWPAYGYGYGYGGWYGWGGYWGPGWGSTSYEVRDLRYDTIKIDMIDAKTGALLWRGSGEKHVHSHWKPEEIDKNVNKTVAKIMNKFPPGSD